jgi:signal peptidase
MARPRDSDDPSPDSDDDKVAEKEPTRSHRTPRRPPARPARHRAPVRKWRGSDDADEDDSDGDLEPPTKVGGLFHRQPRPVYWRARDSLYFEPLVAVAIIVVLLVGLYAYTQNWPPAYVVESGSMQHGSSDVLGVINTGDLVLAQRIPTDQITPYVVGAQTGYSTYGEYGDVILYSPNGQGSTPIIHRAILFLQWDPISSSYNATDLSGLPCGNATNAVYSTPGTLRDCGLNGLTGTIDLYRIGWHSVDVSIDLSSTGLGQHSGFVTMGDNNFVPSNCVTGCTGLPDQETGLSQLVEPGWIVGVARGMLPWFGAVKLLLEGNAGAVPTQSWQFLGLTVIGLILLAFGIHYALRAEGIEDERRKEEEAAAADAEEDDDGPAHEGRGRRFLRAIRPWGREDEADDEDDGPTPPRKHSTRTRSSDHRRGRPAPRVRRDEKAKSKDRAVDDDDL